MKKGPKMPEQETNKDVTEEELKEQERLEDQEREERIKRKLEELRKRDPFVYR